MPAFRLYRTFGESGQHAIDLERASTSFSERHSPRGDGLLDHLHRAPDILVEQRTADLRGRAAWIALDAVLTVLRDDLVIPHHRGIDRHHLRSVARVGVIADLLAL